MKYKKYEDYKKATKGYFGSNDNGDTWKKIRKSEINKYKAIAFNSQN